MRTNPNATLWLAVCVVLGLRRCGTGLMERIRYGEPCLLSTAAGLLIAAGGVATAVGDPLLHLATVTQGLLFAQ
ncbi:hypothetical protein [Oleiharenicola sp. Vm1]|uniref:hypothetical protein n=1 Tax=Oleiharenicola sp. Vm1 TaxID=3398393 RepID=UPI0039F473DE